MSEIGRTIRIEPARLVRALVAIAVLLTLAHVVLLVITASTGHNYIHGLVPLLDLNRERNLPTFFAGCLFLLNALLFMLVAKAGPGSASKTVWPLLAGIFVFSAYDELFSVHERLTGPMREVLRTSGLLYYSWIIVYAPVVALLALRFFPVWWRLARPGKSWLALAAGTYLLGAVGVEMVAGANREVSGEGLMYNVLTTLEESLEMAGLIMLAHGLLSLLELETGDSRIVIQDRDRDSVPPEPGRKVR